MKGGFFLGGLQRSGGGRRRRRRRTKLAGVCRTTTNQAIHLIQTRPDVSYSRSDGGGGGMNQTAIGKSMIGRCRRRRPLRGDPFRVVVFAGLVIISRYNVRGVFAVSLPVTLRAGAVSLV